MRKRITTPFQDSTPPQEKVWLDLNKIARVEITSEDPANPIDAALVPGMKSGWTATQSGEQTLRVLFDEPQKLKRIHLVFIENSQERTQEFVLRWSGDGVAFHDIVRQQYNFNPPTTEVEDYDVNLDGVAALQLKIIPDISGGGAIACLAELLLA
jgi:hypothetical protein